VFGREKLASRKHNNQKFMVSALQEEQIVRFRRQNRSCQCRKDT
jgi:hypothetical protein